MIKKLDKFFFKSSLYKSKYVYIYSDFRNFFSFYNSKPDYYVKGQEFENLEDKTGKLQKELAVLKEIGAEIRFTHEIVFSSTEFLGRHFK